MRHYTYIEVIENATGSVKYRIDVSGEGDNYINRIDHGISITLDSNRYHTTVTETESPLPAIGSNDNIPARKDNGGTSDWVWVKLEGGSEILAYYAFLTETWWMFTGEENILIEEEVVSFTETSDKLQVKMASKNKQEINK